MGGKTHVIDIGCRLAILRHGDRAVPETEVIDSIRALCDRKE